MLSDIGINFGFKGGDAAKRAMDGIGGSYRQLSSNVDSHSPRMMKHFDAMGNSVHRMGQRIDSGLRLAKLAIAGFLTGKAVSGLGDWLKGNPEAQQWTDFLRLKGAGEKELESYEAHFKDISKRVAGVGQADYLSGIYGMQSIFSPQDAERNKKSLESTLLMAKGMSPTTTITEAKDMMRVFSSAYGAGKSPDEKLSLIEKFGAQVPELLTRSTAEAKDITTAMSHIAGLYSQMGQSPAEMLADIGSVAGFARERSGEMLKAIMSKRGEGFGKYAAAIGKELQLERWGVKQETDLPKELREHLTKSVAITKDRAIRRAGEALTKDPTSYARQLDTLLKEGDRLRTKRYFDQANALQESFGETAQSAVPAWVASRVSGEHGKLKGALEKIDPAEQNRLTEKSQQSFAARYKMFEQRIEALSRTAKKPFQALATELMEPYGRAIDDIEKNWASKTDQMSANVVGFAHSAWAGFAAAFGPLPNANNLVNDLVETLGSPNPEKWKEFGENFGRMAGANLKPLTEDLREIAGALREIASVVPSLKTFWEWTGGWAVSGYKQYANEVAPDIAGALGRIPGAPGLGLPPAAQRMQRKDDAAALDQRPMAATGYMALVDGLRSLVERATGSGQVTVHSKPEIKVRIGEREIKDIAVEAVADEFQAEYMANRRGFAEGFGW